MSLPSPDPNATVVVTGASTGIGENLARELAGRGHNLTLVARNRERLGEVAEALRTQHGVHVAVHIADLTDAEERAELVEAVRRDENFVVGLCNNAGFGSVGRFWELDQDEERRQVRLNVDALHELTGAFLPAMVQRGRGAVLNLGSIAGVQPMPGQTTYSATKAFVNSFSEALHAELAGTGVSCTVVTPGPVRTDFFDRAGASDLQRNAPGFVFEEPEKIAREGVEGMERGKRVVVPGLPAKIGSATGRFAPRTVFLPALKAALERGR